MGVDPPKRLKSTLPRRNQGTSDVGTVTQIYLEPWTISLIKSGHEIVEP